MGAKNVTTTFCFLSFTLTPFYLTINLILGGICIYFKDLTRFYKCLDSRGNLDFLKLHYYFYKSYSRVSKQVLYARVIQFFQIYL